MPGSEYECADCRHRFRAPEGVPRDTRSLMCPACGSVNLNLVAPVARAEAVWHTRQGAHVGGPWEDKPSG